MKIRQKFILALLFIGLGPMYVMSVFAYMSASAALLQKTTDQLNSVAIKQSERIGTILQAQQEETTQIANQFDLRVVLANYRASPTEANQQRLDALLQAAKVSHPAMQYIRLFDSAGNNQIASSVTEKSTGDFISKLIMPGSGDVNNLRVVKDPRDGQAKLEISTRISTYGILSVVFRTDDLTAIAQDYTGLDKTGETVVLGNDTKSLFPLRFNADGALETNLPDINVKDATPGQYKTASDYRGHDVLYVSQPVGLSNWHVVTKIDREEALASTAALRAAMGWILFVVAMTIIGMALILTRFFTKPILHMERVARLIGGGDFSASVGFRRKDEMGMLGRSIDTMKDNLSRLIRGIESQRERLEVILNTTTEGIFAIDETGKILLANHTAEKLVGGTAKDLLGQKIQDIFAWQHGMQPFTIDYQESDLHAYENLQFTDREGAKHYVKVIVAPVHEDLQAGRTRAIVTIHDETASHELENMKSDFVSMAAHELRTPLTAVRGYLEMASSKEEKHEADSAVYVGKALKNVNELNGLINNLLDVTRIERGTLVLNMEKIDLADCIVHAVDSTRFAAKDRNIDLTYDGPHDGRFVVGDSIALREIVINLLTNAIKYTQPGGSVKVTLHEKAVGYDVIVTDTGIGMSKEAQKYLFNKFYRVHGGLESGSNGTGLGLYIAKSIAERHSGTIAVDSEEGKGSTFTLSLPVYSDERLSKISAKQNSGGNFMARRKRGWVTKNIAR
ncbi:MAG TPA: ATP-binding protein [Candidatus Saccharimonadales bacterium]|nr:ATP-binding protein [Candidatus Saccharimonadales bacterium]